MGKQIIVILSIILGILLFDASKEGQTHNLMTREQAQAYELFNQWKAENGKQYRQDQETSYRFRKFFANYKFVKKHNEKFAKGEYTFEVALNKFADLDNIEFRSLFTGLKRKDPSATSKCNGQIKILDNPPESVDWTSKAVGPVRNQGQCGSCWAFSACGALEGLAAIHKGKIPTFSPQQLVDCAGGQYGNQGCNGGQMYSAFWYVIDHGIADNWRYSYTAKDQHCGYKPNWKAFSISDCAHVPSLRPIALQSAVAVQPVSVSVQADGLGFQLYSKGVFNELCGIDLDHGILLTGYGSEDGKNYWKCKNSWGSNWGMSGYILMARSNQEGPGKCGIQIDDTVPLL